MIGHQTVCKDIHTTQKVFLYLGYEEVVILFFNEKLIIGYCFVVDVIIMIRDERNGSF
jgi:hypothetical protein